MKTLKIIDEFRVEAKEALFTKQQAVAITLRLLQAELAAAEDAQDRETLSKALQNITFSYLDATATPIDEMLDEVGVARFTSEQIISAIQNVIFDVK